MGPPLGSHVLHWLILGKHEKIFLSETARPKALICGMKHYLVDLYQVCSNNAPVAQNWPALGVTNFTLAYTRET